MTATVPPKPALAITAPGGRPRRTSRGIARRLWHNPSAVVTGVTLVLIIIVAVVSVWWTPRDPYQQDLFAILAPPGTDGFILGADQLGRDVLSRLMVGARVSLVATAQAVCIAAVIGIPLGFTAGLSGGVFDSIVMRVTDGLISFPGLLVAIGIIGVLGPGLTNAMIALGIIFSPRFIRLVRNVVRGISRETYIEAARSMGASNIRIALQHVLRNILSPITVEVAVIAAHVMLAEASLSFLGLGVQPPEPSWGGMVRDGFQFVSRSPTLGVFPGLMITITVLCFVVLGDAMRDAFGRQERKG